MSRHGLLPRATRAMLLAACALGLAAMPACEAPPQPDPPPEAATRIVDGDQEQAFAASAATLMDLGYTIAMSDRRAGLIRGEQALASLTLKVSPVNAHQTEVRAEPMVGPEFWGMLDKQLLVGQPTETK